MSSPAPIGDIIAMLMEASLRELRSNDNSSTKTLPVSFIDNLLAGDLDNWRLPLPQEENLKFRVGYPPRPYFRTLSWSLERLLQTGMLCGLREFHMLGVKPDSALSEIDVSKLLNFMRVVEREVLVAYEDAKTGKVGRCCWSWCCLRKSSSFSFMVSDDSDLVCEISISRNLLRRFASFLCFDLGIRGILSLLGLRHTEGSATLCLPSREELERSFQLLHKPHSKSILTVGAR